VELPQGLARFMFAETAKAAIIRPAAGWTPTAKTGGLRAARRAAAIGRADGMVQQPYRIGLGYDLHRLVPGRPLRLGGVEIDYDRGLAGHSDADVVLHAVADALLGAAALGDIGELFPDTDPRWAGADSRRLLAEVHRQVVEAGWRLVNLDIVVHAQSPRLGPYKRPMREAIAALVGLPTERVNVKAKSGEGLGAVGRGEAIACHAIVLLAAASGREAQP